MHFVKYFDLEETPLICEELKSDYGSFEARIRAVEEYIPSLAKKPKNRWIDYPIIFRTNRSGSRSGIRYDLTYLLKMNDAHTKYSLLERVDASNFSDVSLDEEKQRLPI